jgi:hypothetical protein
MSLGKIKINNEILFAVIGTIVALWQMLLPGYVLTLDMIFTDNWLIQKLFLFAMFFLLFYLPVRFFPFEIDHKFKYWAGIFFAVNPFVYERFLAGHWLVLLLYAMLPPLIYYFIKLFKNFKQNIPFFLFWFLAALLIFSFYFEHFNQVVKISNPEYWQAFKTSSFPIGGSLAEVIMLYGFWGESYPWANYFIWPKLPIILPVFIFIVGLIISGIRYVFKYVGRKETLFLLLLLIMSIIFSVGIGESVFKNLNLWLFKNISFWQVFRDTTKWLALLAYTYAVFGALGVNYVQEKISAKGGSAFGGKTENYRKIILYFIFILPLVYTYPMLGGFARQIKPVWYPESWHEVNQILRQDKDCKALFLPWHLYYSLSFNNNLITANPAPKFFNCQIISSQDIEIGEIKRTTWPDWQDPAQKIKYVIYTPDLEGADIYDYSFVKTDAFRAIYQHKDIILYKIMLK